MKTMFIFLVLVVGMTNVLPLMADPRNDLSTQVLQWVKDGRVKSLDTIMDKYKKRINGRLLDVEVEKENGRIIYELKVMRDDAVIVEIKIDASTGEWLEEEIEN